MTHRERRWYTQPIWRQALSVFMIVALVFTTTPTEVQAQTFTPVFYYYHGDHLGSSNVMTDRNGALVQHYEYAAFGNERFKDNTAAVDMSNRYTGQQLDEETGLYYYNARYYDPELGRFTQPDTIVPNPSDSQQFNRYTYVGNNPLKYTDPSGHDFGISAIIIGVIVGAAIGGAVAAATGGNIGMGILTGAIGGLFGGVGAWAGGALGGAGGAFAGAVAGGAAGGAVSAAVTGGNVGMGALAGAVSGAIGFGVGQLGFSDPGTIGEHLINAGLSSAGGAGGGAAGSALQGGDPALGAAYGAAGGFAGYWLGAGLVEMAKPRGENANGFRYRIKDSNDDVYDHTVTDKAGLQQFKRDIETIRINKAKIVEWDIYGHGSRTKAHIGGFLHFDIDQPFGPVGSKTGMMTLGDMQRHFSGLIADHASIRLQICHSADNAGLYQGMAKLAPTASITGVHGVCRGIGDYGPLLNRWAFRETNPNAWR